MTQPAPTFAKPRGNLPALQWCPVDQLHIDEAYQRSIDNSGSQSMIRTIARGWHWDLCQPLYVARRTDGRMFVVDGQHRLAAARMRGDIDQLPCVLSFTSGVADEAKLFSEFNRRRRPPSALDLYHADLTAGADTATQIHDALAAAGLSMSKHTNTASLKPGQVMNVGGLRRVQSLHGNDVLQAALQAMAKAWPNLRFGYAGTIFPGIAEIARHERAIARKAAGWHAGARFQAVPEFLARKQQLDWYGLIQRAKAEALGTSVTSVAETVLLEAWTKAHP